MSTNGDNKMIYSMSKRIAALLVGMMVIAAASGMQLQAATIGFSGPIGAPVAPTAEGVFTYDTLSGGLFRDTQGNGDGFNMEGLSGQGGGVLRIVRNDLLGGLFTFDAADVGHQFDSVATIAFEGFLLGVSQGADNFVTNALSSYTSFASLVLSNVLIDELRVTLDATTTTAEIIDNVVLTPTVVPLPPALPLMAVALAGLGFTARRKKHAA